jgi:predicted oxidoreductase
MFTPSDQYEFVAQRGRLKAVADKYDWGLDELALIFLLHHPAGILPVLGTTKVERLKKSISLLDKQISDEQWFEIWTAATGENVA